MALKSFLIPPHPVKNFEIQKYDQNKTRFNGVYSGDQLSKKIKNADVGTRWIAFYVKILKLFILIDLVLNMFLKK